MAKVSKAVTMSQWKLTLGLGILASILLVIANSALWVNRYIFDTDNFSSVVTTSLTSESSRQAIAEGVTDRALEDRPVLKKVAGDVPVRLISGLLGTNQAQSVIDTTVTKLQTTVTSEQKASISLDLSGIKNVVTQVVGVASSLGREPAVNQDNIPSEIVLIDKDEIPNFYRIGVVFLWLGPVAFIGALIALVYPYFRDHAQYKMTLAIQGACIAAAGLLALLVGPLFRPPLLAGISTPAGRTVVENLYNAFVVTFNSQTLYVVWLGFAVALLAVVLYSYPMLRQRR